MRPAKHASSHKSNAGGRRSLRADALADRDAFVTQIGTAPAGARAAPVVWLEV
jgi:hypothetical protein